MAHTPDHSTATAGTGRPARHARTIRPTPLRGALAATVLAVALSLGLAACGGSSSTHTVSTPAAPAIHATLTAPTHTPKANAPWHYVVRVTNAAGRPVAAVVHLQVMFQGAPVGQIGLHRVSNGVWSESIKWPAASVGQPLVFQVVATALATTATINYPLQVAPA